MHIDSAQVVDSEDTKTEMSMNPSNGQSRRASFPNIVVTATRNGCRTVHLKQNETQSISVVHEICVCTKCLRQFFELLKNECF